MQVPTRVCRATSSTSRLVQSSLVKLSSRSEFRCSQSPRCYTPMSLLNMETFSDRQSDLLETSTRFYLLDSTTAVWTLSTIRWELLHHYNKRIPRCSVRYHGVGFRFLHQPPPLGLKRRFGRLAENNEGTQMLHWTVSVQDTPRGQVREFETRKQRFMQLPSECPFGHMAVH
jgi:hypothetical protein